MKKCVLIILHKIYILISLRINLWGDTDLELGGNITLAGFKDVDHAELVVSKKK